MSKVKIDVKAFERLGNLVNGDQTAVEEDHAPWSPQLTPTQQFIFDSAAEYILVHGNRGGGKTYTIGHKLVRHCYENFNALAVIIVGVRSQATQGGIWDKLDLEIFPEWKNGLDLGITESKEDKQGYQYRMIRNCHGGWSKILLMSLASGAQIEARIKGFEPSIVFVDELTTLTDPAFFNAVSQQLGRRPNIKGVQQYIAATNPDSPENWVYKRFFTMPWEESVDVKGKVISPAGEWDNRYFVVQLQAEENVYLDSGYYNKVVEATRGDPTLYQRNVLGDWVDRPSGNAIFGTFFREELHMLGSPKQEFAPSPKFPIIIGSDVGAVDHAFAFMQYIPTKKGATWLVFDELVIVQKKLHIRELTLQLMRVMKYWERRAKMSFKFMHYSDNSAFNQFRTSTGSYDVMEMERHSQEIAKNLEMNPIRIMEAPKFNGSKSARVRLLMQLLQSEEIIFSHRCRRMKQMLLNLESENEKKGVYNPDLAFQPKRSQHLHPFDALTYPILSLSVSSNSHHLNFDSGKKTEIIEIGHHNG
jgi:PBSX family phage terminase large subunit